MGLTRGREGGEGRVGRERSETSEPGAARPPARRAVNRAGGALRGAGRLGLPSDLHAAAVCAERFVFAAAPLTAAITLAPRCNLRGAER